MATTAETLQSLLEGETANTGAINTLTGQMAGTTASGLKTKIDTLDGAVVKTTGDQNISGDKTFLGYLSASTFRRENEEQESYKKGLSIYAGFDYSTGARIQLFGKDYDDDTLKGGVRIGTQSGDKAYNLNLKSSGELSWSADVKGTGFAAAGMPSASRVTISSCGNGKDIEFTEGETKAPYNCYLFIGSLGGKADDYICLLVNNLPYNVGTIFVSSSTRGVDNQRLYVTVPVPKGSYVTFFSNMTNFTLKAYHKCIAEV